MVILSVLGFVLILTVLLTQFTGFFVQVEDLQADIRRYEQQQVIARSALEMAIFLLDEDDKTVDSFFDTWNQTQPIVTDGWTVKVEIEDLERKFWVNGVATNTAVDPLLAQGVLERFLDQTGHRSQLLLPVLIDWIDTDSIAVPGGAEQSSYRNLIVPNRPLDSLESLTDAEGWGASSLGPPRQGEEIAEPLAFPGWSPWGYYLTCYSSGKLNLNTAPIELIEALDSDMNQGLAHEVVALRKRSPLESFSDLKQISAFDEDFIFRLQRVAGFASEYFLLRIELSRQGEKPGLFQAVVHRTKPNSEVVLWSSFGARRLL